MPHFFDGWKQSLDRSQPTPRGREPSLTRPAQSQQTDCANTRLAQRRQ